MSPCSSDYILTGIYLRSATGLWRIVSEDFKERRISDFGTLRRDPRAFIEYASSTIFANPSVVM